MGRGRCILEMIVSGVWRLSSNVGLSREEQLSIVLFFKTKSFNEP